MRGRKALLITGIFAAIIFAFSVSAAFPSDGIGRIGDFFANREFSNQSTIIDFMIFFLIFFSLCWLGFSKWFGQGFGKPGTAKGAVIGLSLGLGLLFSFGLVIHGKFTIAKIFPIAKNFLFLVFWFLLYALVSRPELVGNDKWWKKLTAMLLSGILLYILFNIFTAYVCALENNESDPACQGGILTFGQEKLDGVWMSLSESFERRGGSGGAGESSGTSDDESSGVVDNTVVDETGGAERDVGEGGLTVSDGMGLNDNSRLDLPGEESLSEQSSRLFSSWKFIVPAILVMFLLIGSFVWRVKKHKEHEESGGLVHDFGAGIRAISGGTLVGLLYYISSMLKGLSSFAWRILKEEKGNRSQLSADDWYILDDDKKELRAWTRILDRSYKMFTNSYARDVQSLNEYLPGRVKVNYEKLPSLGDIAVLIQKMADKRALVSREDVINFLKNITAGGTPAFPLLPGDLPSVRPPDDVLDNPDELKEFIDERWHDAISNDRERNFNLVLRMVKVNKKLNDSLLLFAQNILSASNPEKDFWYRLHKRVAKLNKGVKSLKDSLENAYRWTLSIQEKEEETPKKPEENVVDKPEEKLEESK